MTPNNGSPDRDAAEDQLIALAAEGAARRLPFGHDALWVPPAPHAAGLAAAA
jgi:hypothetical protein